MEYSSTYFVVQSKSKSELFVDNFSPQFFFYRMVSISSTRKHLDLTYKEFLVNTNQVGTFVLKLKSLDCPP